MILPSSGGGSGSGSGRFGAPRQELVNTYSVEAQDEAALTEYLESSGCRRAVLARHLDGDLEGADCVTTDSIPCDRCHGLVGQGSGSGEDSIEAIHQAHQLDAQRDEQLERFHQLLHAHCIFCQLMLPDGEEHSHCHQECRQAPRRKCDIEAYRQWRSRLQLAPRNQCFRCGLSQSVCPAVEDQAACVYPHLMLPGIFFLHQVGQLLPICREVGFGGGEEWQWQWMNGHGEEAFGRVEINWMRVWRRVAAIYIEAEDG